MFFQDPDPETRATALHLAASAGHIDCVTLICGAVRKQTNEWRCGRNGCAIHCSNGMYAGCDLSFDEKQTVGSSVSVEHVDEQTHLSFFEGLCIDTRLCYCYFSACLFFIKRCNLSLRGWPVLDSVWCSHRSFCCNVGGMICYDESLSVCLVVFFLFFFF